MCQTLSPVCVRHCLLYVSDTVSCMCQTLSHVCVRHCIQYVSDPVSCMCQTLSPVCVRHCLLYVSDTVSCMCPDTVSCMCQTLSPVCVSLWHTTWDISGENRNSYKDKMTLEHMNKLCVFFCVCSSFCSYLWNGELSHPMLLCYRRVPIAGTVNCHNPCCYVTGGFLSLERWTAPGSTDHCPPACNTGGHHSRTTGRLVRTLSSAFRNNCVWQCKALS